MKPIYTQKYRHVLLYVVATFLLGLFFAGTVSAEEILPEVLHDVSNVVDFIEADFNRDGIQDLLVLRNIERSTSGYSLLRTYYGEGQGLYGEYTETNSEVFLTHVADIATADFDGDQNQDLFVVRDDCFMIFSYEGGGYFHTQTARMMPLSAMTFSLDDMNGDGLADIAIGFSDYREEKVYHSGINTRGKVQLQKVTTATE